MHEAVRNRQCRDVPRNNYPAGVLDSLNLTALFIVHTANNDRICRRLVEVSDIILAATSTCNSITCPDPEEKVYARPSLVYSASGIN